MAKLKTEHTKKLLTSFAKGIIEQAKKILKAKKKNVSGKLLNSLKYKLKADKNGFTLSFKGAKHANFVDKGVSGVKKRRMFNNIYGKTKKSPFSFKSGVGNSPNIGALEKWISRKGIRGRGELGRFIKTKSLAYLFSKSIQREGLKATSFFSTSVYTQYKKFKPKLLAAFKQDIIKRFEKIETSKI